MSGPYFFDTYVDETPKEWQNFVDSSPLYNIFQTEYWAKAMREAGLHALLIVARNEDGDIMGGALATYSSYSFLKLNATPIITIRGGPIVYNVNDEYLIETIIRFFDSKAKRRGSLTSFIRTFFPLDKILVKRLNYTVKYDSLPCTIILDLSKPLEELWKTIDKSTRREIRKAEKVGIIIEEAKCLNDLLAYYQICRRTGKRLKTSTMSFNILESSWRNFSQAGNFKLFLAKYKTRPIAGCIALRWLDKMWAWHRASLKQYWHLNPNQLLDWYRIKWGVKNHVKTYDLLGIPCKENKKHPKYGLYIYKKHFGKNIVRHGEYVKNYFPLRSFLLARILRPIRARLSVFKRTEEEN